MSEMERNEFETTTTATEQTEDLAKSLDALDALDDDEDSEKSGISLLGVGRDALAIWKLCDLAGGAWNGFKNRIVAAEQRKQERANQPSLKERIINKFTKQTKETPTSTEEKSVETKSESGFDAMTLEQIVAYTQALEEAKQQKLKELEEARKNLEEQIKAIK